MSEKCICSDYTKKRFQMTTKYKDYTAWFSLYEHYMEVIDDRPEGNIISFKIKFCPMCGRELS